MKLTFDTALSIMTVVYLIGGAIVGYHLSGWIFTFPAVGIFFSCVLYVVAVIAFFIMGFAGVPGDPPTASPDLALATALPFLSFGLILGFLGASASLIFF